MSRAGIVTVGSINIDLVVYAQRRPEIGETLAGERFSICPGGKGANQAIQASLSGARSIMVARLGTDIFAPMILNLFAETGVDCSYIVSDPAGTGIGHVTVDGSGNYAAVIVARANGNLSAQDIDQARPAFESSRVLLLQLEIPLSINIYAARIARQLGLQVFLNAAPAMPIPAELMECVDILIVNEIEATMLSGLPISSSTESIIAALEKLGTCGRHSVVLSLGALGVAARDAHGRRLHLPAHPVKVINTIGAGDAFVGELATRMAEGMSLFEALPYSNAAGALAVTKATSHNARFNREQIEALVSQQMRGQFS